MQHYKTWTSSWFSTWSFLDHFSMIWSHPLTPHPNLYSLPMMVVIVISHSEIDHFQNSLNDAFTIWNKWFKKLMDLQFWQTFKKFCTHNNWCKSKNNVMRVKIKYKQSHILVYKLTVMSIRKHVLNSSSLYQVQLILLSRHSYPLWKHRM
jgi:hypothetical protein